MPKLPDYGIDAPTIVRNNAVVGLLAWTASLAAFVLFRRSNADLAWAILARGGITGAILVAVASYMVWSSKIGKFRIRDKLLNSVPWRGDEKVLDIGCGRGLAIVGAARRLNTGHATGVDLWSSTDLSGNTAQATEANAVAEGVANKISIETGDARALPFADETFDVVMSMTAIHNIKDKAGRRKAVNEAVRVLKPGGSLAIFDIFHAGTYLGWLKDSGLQDVSKSGVIFLWMIPGRLLTATKRA